MHPSKKIQKCSKSPPNSPSLLYQHQFPGIPWLGNRDSCWAGLPPVLVHVRVPVHPQFTHTLIFLKQHPISSGSWLFRTEKRSMACQQYNICPSHSVSVSLFIPIMQTQKSPPELVPQHLNLCSDPMCRSTPSIYLPFSHSVCWTPSATEMYTALSVEPQPSNLTDFEDIAAKLNMDKCHICRSYLCM